MAEIEIGIYKSGRQAYGFDDIAIVPSRRTRDPEDVDISWQLDAFRFELPLLGAAMDGVVSPPPRSSSAASAARRARTSRVSGRATRTRRRCSTRSASSTTTRRRARMQQMYLEPVRPELVTQRIQEISAAGVIAAASVTPQRTASSPTRARRPSSTSS